MDCTDTELLLEVQRRLIDRENNAPLLRQRKAAKRLHDELNGLFPLMRLCGIDVAPLSGGLEKP